MFKTKLFVLVAATLATTFHISATAEEEIPTLNLKTGNVVVKTSDPAQYFQVEGIQDVFIQSWQGAHYIHGDVLYLANFTYFLKKGVTINGQLTHNVQVTFYPSDTQILIDASHNPVSREAYLQDNIIHFVEKTDDPDFPERFNEAILTDLSKKNMSVYLDPKNLTECWYKTLVTVPKSDSSSSQEERRIK